MRVVLFLALVAGVSAVQQALAPELVKEIASTKFGESILLELQEDSEYAPSLDRLYKLVADIRKRIEDAQEADTARNADRGRVCAEDLLSLNQKLNNTILAIKAKQGQIAETSSQIGRLTRAIVIMEEKIINDRQNLHKARIMLGNETRLRFMDHAIYEQRVIDTKAAQAAVEEILNLDWTLLEANADDDKTDFADQTLDNNVEAGLNDVRAGPSYNAEGDENVGITGAAADEAEAVSRASYEYSTSSQFYPTAFAEKLSKAAKNLKDSTVTGLLQVAAAAVQGLRAGDVAKLKKLLQDLGAELETYEQELHDGERQAAADWIVQEQAIRASIREWEEKLAADLAEKARLINRKADATEALSNYQTQWSGLKEQVTGNPAQPGALEILITATENECNHWEEAYAARTATRTDELETITAIEAIIEKRMSSYTNNDQAKFTTDGLDSATPYGTTIPGNAANEYSGNQLQ